MYQRLIAGVALATVVCAMGCQKKTETPPARQSAQTSADTSAVAPPPLAGVWTIIAHYMPEATPMTDAEAKSWIGRTLRLSATEVVSGDVTCRNPSFSESVVARDTLLGMDVGYPPGALLRLATVDPLTLVNVSCDGKPLNALGRLIIKVDSDHVLAPWEGVFFELARVASR